MADGQGIPPLPDYLDLSLSLLSMMRDHGEEHVARELARWYMARGCELYSGGLIECAADAFLKSEALLGASPVSRDADHAFDRYVNALWLGTVHQRMNRHPEARAYFKLAFEIDPQRCAETGGVAEYLARHGTQDEIKAHFSLPNLHEPLAPFFATVQSVFPAMVGQLADVIKRARAVGDDRPEVLIPVPVWGAKFVGILLDYAVPCWLAAGNFPELSRTRRLHLIFFCDKQSKRKIEGSARATELARYADIHFITYNERLMAPATHHVARFQLFSLPHYVSLECARQCGCDVVFAFVDNVVSDGFYGAVGAMLERQPSAIVCHGFRLAREAVLPTIEARFRRPDGVLALPSTEIVGLLIDHLDASVFADSRHFASHPFVICWRVGDDGILARSSHWQPYAIRGCQIAKPLWPRIDPMDGQFLHQFLTEPGKIVCVDDACTIDIGSSNAQDVLEERTLSEYQYARFLHEYLTPLHRRYLRVPIRLVREQDPAAWSAVEDESGRLIEEVLQIVDGFEARAPVRPHWAAEG